MFSGLLVYKYLDISVNNVVFMKIQHSKTNLTKIENCLPFSQSFLRFQEVKHLASRVVVHHKHNEVLAFKCMLQFAYKRTLYSCHYLLFVFNNVLLVLRYNKLFSDELHCQELSIQLPSHQIHFGKAPYPNAF